MPLDNLLRDAATECYLDSRPQIFGMCAKFQRVYGGEITDLISEAHEHFMFIWMTHDSARGNFEGDIQFRLWRRMLETKEREANRARILPRVDLDDYMKEDPEPFDLADFASQLDPDAAEVVNLVFNSPPDVDLAIIQRGEPTPNNIRNALKEYLKDIGWSIGRVIASFNHIREALKND